MLVSSLFCPFHPREDQGRQYRTLDAQCRELRPHIGKREPFQRYQPRSIKHEIERVDEPRRPGPGRHSIQEGEHAAHQDNRQEHEDQQVYRLHLVLGYRCNTNTNHEHWPQER